MNIAVYDSTKIISNVIVLDFVPTNTDTEFYAECPAWCWIGDSIEKEKPDDWIDPTTLASSISMASLDSSSESISSTSSLEQRISDLEDALQALMFDE